jgi:hypothetical protein
MAALWLVAVMSNVRAMQVRVTHIGQPAQRFLFELVFGHDGHVKKVSTTGLSLKIKPSFFT